MKHRFSDHCTNTVIETSDSLDKSEVSYMSCRGVIIIALFPGECHVDCPGGGRGLCQLPRRRPGIWVIFISIIILPFWSFSWNENIYSLTNSFALSSVIYLLFQSGNCSIILVTSGVRMMAGSAWGCARRRTRRRRATRSRGSAAPARRPSTRSCFRWETRALLNRPSPEYCCK